MASQQTPFRKAEKKYAKRSQQPDLADVIGFDAQHLPDSVCRLRLTRDLQTPDALPYRLFRHTRPPAYALQNHPGLIVIPDALSDEAQRQLARKCLCDCTRPPNRTNLDPFFAMPAESLFTLAHSKRMPGSEVGALCSSPATAKQPLRIQSRVEDGSLQGDVTVPKGKLYTRSASPSELLEPLRWCTLGRQYNWTTKEYDLGTSAFDTQLDSIMKAVASAIVLPQPEDLEKANGLWINDYDARGFVSQAGIINYYDERSVMAGHVDRTEENMDAPLISLCIGLSCVYLIGGPTRDTDPTAIFLRSGDVLAMCGESRLAYHGVPRILPGSTPTCLSDPAAGDSDANAGAYPEWRHFATYLTTHRINCNARKCTSRDLEE